MFFVLFTLLRNLYCSANFDHGSCLGGNMRFPGRLGAPAIGAAFFMLFAESAAAQSGRNLYLEINNSVVQNILLSVRDQIRAGRPVSSPGRLGFGAVASDFDNRNPFAVGPFDAPFRALAYAKAPAAAPAPAWLYGANLAGSGDRSMTWGIATDTSTVTGAFDVTRIGIFAEGDALTFVGSGATSWSHQGGLLTVETSAPATSGTLAYLNGGFSADFTSFAGWTRTAASIASSPLPIIEASSLGFTGNVQYRFDFPYSVFIEPTIGVTYSEGYTANFGSKISDMTEVHAGARVGTAMRWMDFIVQPTVSASAYQITDSNALGFTGPIIPQSVIGYRASSRVAVIWTPNFSSYLEVRASGMAGGPTKPIPTYSMTQTTGLQGGLRYTWN
ncbi:MAG: hypothetical protein Q7T86_19420 [Hyphomicrobiaceae bacterium]|nr:hypothetical protein [Hyphomicrobiaceae bacterium]